MVKEYDLVLKRCQGLNSNAVVSFGKLPVQYRTRTTDARVHG